MQKMRLIPKLFLGLSLVILSSLACSSQTDGLESNSKTSGQTKQTERPKDAIVFEGSGVKGGTLVLPIEGNPTGYNTMIASGVSTSSAFEGTVFLALVDYDVMTKDIRMELAKKMEILDEGLRYRFTLREGLQWSDGHPFTVEDVVFTYNMMKDPKHTTSLRALFLDSKGKIPELTVVNDGVVEFKLDEVNLLFESVVGSLFILPKHKLNDAYLTGNYQNTWLLNTDPQDIVGMGPYRVKKFVADQSIVYERNPYFFTFDKAGQRLPYYDRIVRVIAPNMETTLVKFRDGQTDYHEVRADHYDLLKREEDKGNFKVHELGASLNTYYLSFNLNNRLNKQGKPYVAEKHRKVFGDKRFRQAVSYALDRKGVVKTVFQGRATPLYGPMSPGNTVWYDDSVVKKYEYNLDKARALLKDMGLKDSDGDGLLEFFDGSPLKFSIKTNSENNARIQIANLLKDDLKKLGIEVSIHPLPFASLLTQLNDTYNYEAVIMGWGSGVPADPIMSKNMYMSNGRLHTWNPRQPEPQTEWEAQIDKWMSVNQSTFDRDERKKAYNEIVKIWNEYQPQVYIVAPNFFIAGRNHIGNSKVSVLRPYYAIDVEELYDKRLEK